MKHFHILKRVRLKSTKEIFMCADPECNWTRRKEYLIGKKFQCPYCINQYIATPEMLRLRTPHCNSCTGEKVTTIQDPLVAQILEKAIQVVPMSELHKGTE